MRILTIGDVVGSTGYNKLRKMLPLIIEEEKIDFTVVNGENAADGFGLLEEQYRNLVKAGANVITMGDHTWGKKDIFKYIDEPHILRPANLPKDVPGSGYTILEINKLKICTINLIGRTFMSVLSNSPFERIDEILNNVKADIYIVDFHAEATAEKIAFGRYVDGKVNIVFGTHTHVPTADEKVLPKGTGYISDVGMTGPINSVIGMDIDTSLKRFLKSIPEKYKLALGEVEINGAIFDIDDKTKKVTKVTRIVK